MRFPFSDLPAFRRDPLALFSDRAKSSELGFTKLYLTHRPVHLATDPQIARQILKWDTGEIDKGRLVQTLKPIMGNSLLTNVGEAHNRSRTAIHRHLQRNAIATNVNKMSGLINSFVARTASAGHIDFGSETATLALRLGCVALFGDDVLNDADQLVLVEAVRVVEAELAADMFRLLPRPPWTKAQRAERLALARNSVSLVVSRAKASGKTTALLDALVDAGLSDEEISAEMLGLLIAGHHTTGATISWLLYHLAVDPTISELITIEADAALPSIERGDVTVLREASLSLAFVKEILRAYPAGWWTSREAMVPVTIAGQKFKPGDNFLISPWQLHRDERIWEMPETIKLDRDFNNPAYLPFGFGPRSCIGASIAWFELQLFVLQVASSLEFDVVDQGIDAVPIPSVTLLAPPMRLAARTRTSTRFRVRAA